MVSEQEGLDQVVAAAAAAQHAGWDLDQVIEELALVLETALPEICHVDRMGHGPGPVRRLQVLAGRDCLVCERSSDGSWITSVSALHGNVTGPPQRVPPEVWVGTLRQRLQERARDQSRLADRLRGLLG